MISSGSVSKENCDFNDFVTDFCLTIFTLYFGYNKADQPDALAYGFANIFSGCPISR